MLLFRNDINDLLVTKRHTTFNACGYGVQQDQPSLSVGVDSGRTRGFTC